jgi:hypothetical protein
MPKIHVVVAIEGGIKKEAEKALTDAHRLKPELSMGLSKSYQPTSEDGERFPSEAKLLQVRVEDVLRDVGEKLTAFYDITLTKEAGNQKAVADVLLDGKVFLTKVPIIILIWLEKRLEDLLTYTGKLPQLPADETWTWDPAQSCYATPPTKTHKTAKVEEPLVLAQATKEHPAQTKVITVDRTIGHWTTVKTSGALQGDRIREIQTRVRKLQAAVKTARQTANNTDVDNQVMGATIFGYLFAK